MQYTPRDILNYVYEKELDTQIVYQCIYFQKR